jgi:hypothetical protein
LPPPNKRDFHAEYKKVDIWNMRINLWCMRRVGLWSMKKGEGRISEV